MTIIDLGKYKQMKRKPKYLPIHKIKEKLQPMLDYIEKPLKNFDSTHGQRFTAEEHDQMKRIVIKGIIDWLVNPELVEEMKKYWPNRTESSLLGKVREIKKKDEELLVSYTQVCIGLNVLERYDLGLEITDHDIILLKRWSLLGEDEKLFGIHITPDKYCKNENNPTNYLIGQRDQTFS